MHAGKFSQQKTNLVFFSIIGIGLVILTSCNNKDANVSSSKNDTTNAIQLAIKTILEEDFPDAPSMKRVGLFHDSIYFAASNLVPASRLPERVDSFHIKVLADTLLCARMKSDTSYKELPNYLKLDSFENRDTGYFVKLESLNCRPGGEAGSLGIFIVKTKDNIVFERQKSHLEKDSGVRSKTDSGRVDSGSVPK
jgi:hypothetical protein